MKKIKLLVFAILVCIPFVVQAQMRELNLKEQFNSEYYSMEYDGNYLVGTFKIIKEDTDYFRLYDMGGNTIIESPHSGNAIGMDESYLYTGLKDKENGLIQIFKYEKKTGKKIADLTINYDGYMDGIRFFYNDNGIVAGSWDDNYCYVINKDLQAYEEVEFNPDLYVTKEYKVTRTDTVSKEEYTNIVNFLLKNGFDENDQKLDYAIEFKGNYYTAIRQEGDIYSIIGINKELTEYTINPIDNDAFVVRFNKSIKDIYTDNNRLTVLIEDHAACPSSNEVTHIGSGCAGNYYLQMYNIDYLINTKTDGNGIIISTKEHAAKGEEINFELKPSDGYVLSEAKVTDSNGNVIVFTENTFTMPSADVLIEATFKKAEAPKEDNPETADFISLFVATILLILEILTINYFNKKAKEN